MRTIRDYLNDAIFVRDNIQSEVSNIVKVNEVKILDLNREKQLFDLGIDSDGRLLQAYTPYTVSLKRLKGEAYNRTTLLDTGEFYAGFKLIDKKTTISIFSTDYKSSELQDKYGSSIFGLTSENSQYLNYNIIKPQLDAFIKKYL